MLIHQGWFTALYTLHLLDSQSLEFEICIFPREAIPSHYFPLREDSSRVLAWGLHSLHEKCRSVGQNQQNFILTDKIFYFVRQKCLAKITTFLMITYRTVLHNCFVFFFLAKSCSLPDSCPAAEKRFREDWTTWVRQLRYGSCHHPTAATNCNEQPS